MKLLIFLLIIVFIVKLYKLYILEAFDGNCIKTFLPNFSDSSLLNQEDIYSGISSGDIDSDLLTWELTDFSNSETDISNYMQDPANDKYNYYDDINCKLSYLNFN